MNQGKCNLVQPLNILQSELKMYRMGNKMKGGEQWKDRLSEEVQSERNKEANELERKKSQIFPANTGEFLCQQESMTILKCLSQSQNENTTAKSKTQQQITNHNCKIGKYDCKTKTQLQKEINTTVKRKTQKIDETQQQKN